MDHVREHNSTHYPHCLVSLVILSSTFSLSCCLNVKAWLNSLFLPFWQDSFISWWFSLFIRKSMLCGSQPFWDVSSLMISVCIHSWFGIAKWNVLAILSQTGSSSICLHHSAKTKRVKITYDFHIAKLTVVSCQSEPRVASLLCDTVDHWLPWSTVFTQFLRSI